MGKLEQEWRNRSIEALRISKAAGTVPGSAERLAQNVHKSRVPWQEHLQRFFSQLVPFNYTWYPPDRRYAHMGLYLPSIESRGVGGIAALIDVSGSIGQYWLDQCSAELARIVDEVQPEMLHVVYFDSQVRKVERYGPGEPFRLQSTGGGGTSFVPPFEYLDTLPRLPLGIVVFTDLQCSDYPAKPDAPVLFVTDAPELTPKFGDVIRLEVA